MKVLRHPRRTVATLVTAAALAAGTAVSVSVALPAAATAGTLLPAATTPYNSTPDCPVSATAPVCGWNVPVDNSNPFTALDYGQCPYWAAEKYPLLVIDEVLSDPLGNDWNGGSWLEHAVEEGLGVSSTPASGDLAVFQSTLADPSGHVAYVEAVDGSAIIVSQMDGDSSPPFPALQGSTEYIDSANLAYYRQSYGLEFVATGSVSSTPLSYVETPTPAAATTPAVTTTAGTPTPPNSKAAAAKKAAAARKRRRAEAAAKKRAAKQRAEKRSRHAGRAG